MKKLATIVAAFFAVCSFAEEKGKDDSAALQNAESASVPREIPIGLPESTSGAIILEDGTQMAQSLVRHYFHWAGGNSYSSTRVMSLTETLISCGQIAMAVDSRTKIGGDTPEGVFTSRTSSNGLVRFDGAVSGALSKQKGWYYSGGMYVNMDPTSVNAPNRHFIDQKHILKGCLTKKWGDRAEISAMAKYSLCSETTGNGYAVAPYVYDGKGGISTLNGFRLGRDCYFVDDDYVVYKDVLSGSNLSGHISQMDRKRILDFHIDGHYRFQSGWDLGAHLQFCTLPEFSTAENGMGGIVKASDGAYTYKNGTPCDGEYVQLRVVTPHIMQTRDIYALLTARKTYAKSEFNAGIMWANSLQCQQTSSFTYAHEVCANPRRIYLNDQNTWNLNGNSLYFDALANHIHLYVLEDWDPTPRLHLRGGVRLKIPFYEVHCAANRMGETKFNRVDGFCIADKGGVDSLNTFTHRDIDAVLKFDYHFIGAASYKLGENLFLMADGFYSLTNKATTYFKGNRIPSLKPIGNALGRFGFTWNREFSRNAGFSASVIASYITCWNCAAFSYLSNRIPQPNMEMTTYLAEYGIGTPGVTFDGNFRNGGFNLHAMVTFVDPRYRNYDNDVTFSDGHIEHVSFSGKVTAGISKVRVELDPSYSFGNWTAAANIRYFSRQYASKNNLAYFNGHFETFANVDWKFAKNCKLSLYFVNLFFQDGAKGSISSADSAGSEAELAGTILAGTYIRPFTVDLGFTYRF